MSKTAISYRRFSSKKQERGESLKRQLEDAQRFCLAKGWKLDQMFTDTAKSAWSGKHLSKGELGVLVSLCEQGKIKAGWVIIVEDLSRLSRLGIWETLELVKRILTTGIELCTINPEMHLTLSDLNDMPKMMMLVVYADMYRKQSDDKSRHVSSRWKAKHEQARLGVKMTRKTKGWLVANKNRTKYIPKPGAKETLNLIFQLATEGLGIDRIIKHLVEHKVKHFQGGQWARKYVRDILHDRAVLGEFQGIKDYYPALVDVDLFNRAELALSKRSGTGGPRGTKVANLFTGLVYFTDGHKAHLTAKNPSRPALVSYGAIRKLAGSEYRSFPYRSFETCVLLYCRDALPVVFGAGNNSKVQSAIENTIAKKASIERKIAKAKQRAKNEPELSDIVLDLLSDLQKEKNDVERTLVDLQTELAQQTNGHLNDTLELLNLLDKTKGNELIAVRQKLKGKLALLISRIDIRVLDVSTMTRRLALVVITFANGQERKFVIDKKHSKEFPEMFVVTDGVEFNELMDLSNFRKRGKGTPGA
jgi:DNA invertase Pin-like site-specific DNA recombinase